MSGRTAWVSLDPDCTVQELRRQAQLELGVPLDRLFKSIGDSTRAPALQALPNTRTLNKAGLHDGQVLTGSVRETKIASYLGSCGSPVRSFTLEDLYSPFDALAIEWEDGSIRICSNDPFPASDSMCGVQHVTASSRAFAAIQEDGRVTAFGDPDAGGDVKSVLMISSTHRAFAALRSDGHVVAWGDPQYGGNCERVQEHLHSVKMIQSNVSAFAAIREDGQVTAWGNPEDGGECMQCLSDVTNICAANHAFAAVRADRSLVTWGSKLYGGDIADIAPGLEVEDVQAVCASGNAFAAICSDGAVVAWGCPHSGGSASGVQEQLPGATDGQHSV
eukprot:s397_g53.t1